MKLLIVLMALSVSFLVIGCDDASDSLRSGWFGVRSFPGANDQISMDFDREGRVYIGAMPQAGSEPGTPPMIRRFSSKGELELEIPLHAKERYFVRAFKIVLGGAEEAPLLFVVGWMQYGHPIAPVNQMFVQARTLDGEVVFSEEIGALVLRENARDDLQVAADSDGNLYVAGSMSKRQENVRGLSFFLRRYDAALASPPFVHETDLGAVCRPWLNALALSEPAVDLRGGRGRSAFLVFDTTDCTVFPGATVHDTSREANQAVVRLMVNEQQISKDWTVAVPAWRDDNTSDYPAMRAVGAFALDNSFLVVLEHDNGYRSGFPERPASRFSFYEQTTGKRVASAIDRPAFDIAQGVFKADRFFPRSVSGDGMISGYYRREGIGVDEERVEPFVAEFSVLDASRNTEDAVKMNVNPFLGANSEIVVHKFNPVVGSYFAAGFTETVVDGVKVPGKTDVFVTRLTGQRSERQTR